MRNKKQAYSENKVFAAKNKIMQHFALLIFAFIGFMVVGVCMSGSISETTISAIIGSGFSMAIVIPGFINGNPLNSMKSGKNLSNKVYLLPADAYDDTIPFPERVGREIGNIPLKAGRYWSKLMVIIDSSVPKSDGTMGDSAATITNEFATVLGGAEDDIFNLLEYGIGQQFYVVYEECSSGKRSLGGNRCKPMTLTAFSWISDKDKTAANVTFKNECGEMFSTYVGNTPLQAAVVVAANATAITITSSQTYQLTSGTAAAATIGSFAGVTDTDVHRVITIYGSGGAFPSTIAASSSFMLNAGTTWTANTGASITFKIFKSGASAYSLIEISRT